jgi:hypothetical protein
VPDRGNDRDWQGRDRARYALFVERPQVLDGSAAASDNDNVDAGDAPG